MKRMFYFATRVYEHWNRSWSAMKECLLTAKNGYGAKNCPTLCVWLFFRQLCLRHQAGPDHLQIASDCPLIQTLNFGWPTDNLGHCVCTHNSNLAATFYYLVHQPCESYVLAMKQSWCVEIKIIRSYKNKRLSQFCRVKFEELYYGIDNSVLLYVGIDSYYQKTYQLVKC